MSDLRTDILEVVASSRLPLSAEEVWQDVRIWPLHRGEKMRTVSPETIADELANLCHEGKLDSVSINGVQQYRIPRVVRREQRELFT